MASSKADSTAGSKAALKGMWAGTTADWLAAYWVDQLAAQWVDQLAAQWVDQLDWLDDW